MVVANVSHILLQISYIRAFNHLWLETTRDNELKIVTQLDRSLLIKKMGSASRFCVSSLRRGHANLLCIDPILVYVVRMDYILMKITPRIKYPHSPATTKGGRNFLE